MTTASMTRHLWIAAWIAAVGCHDGALAGVTNSTSGGAVVATIQAAVNAANNGDTLLVSTGMYAEHVRIVQKSLEIYGGYALNFTQRTNIVAWTRIDGTASGSALTVLSNCVVLLDGLMLTNGNAGFGLGGGVQLNVTAVLTAQNCAVCCNLALIGGGIGIGTNSTAVLRDTPVYRNAGALGGGVGALTRTASVICEGPDTDVRDNYAGWGGGIFADGATVQMLDNADLYSNVANERGGGIYLGGGARGRFSDTSTIIGQDANRATNVMADGGGAYVADSSLVVENDAEFWANHATQRGGGIFVTNGSVVVRNHASIGRGDGSVSNYAGMLGGGICAMASTVVVSNQARIVQGYAQYGGGVMLWDSSGIFEHATLRGNLAVDSGGGLYAGLASAVTLAACVLDGNRAVSQYGGGAMFNSIPSAVLISNTVFASNTASAAGAMIAQYCPAVTLQGGGMVGNSASLAGAAYFAVCPSLRVADLQVTSNVAQQFAGLFIAQCPDFDLADCDLRYNRNTNTAMGALALILSTGRLRTQARPAEVRGNYADSGAGIALIERSTLAIEAPVYPLTIADHAVPGSGGGIWCANATTVTVVGAVQFVSNTAAFGGALFVTNRAVVSLLPTNGVGPVFLGNTALVHGGALCLMWNSQVTAVNSTFRGNEAVNYGGAAFSERSLLRMRGDGSGAAGLPPCVFMGNRADYGGVVYNSMGALELADALVASNTAATTGGGLRNANGGQAALVNCVLVDNSATTGAGIGNSVSSALQLRHCTVVQNHNDGVQSSGGPMAATNCIVRGNTGTEFSAGQSVNYSDIGGGYPGAGNIDANPLFANPAVLDFALTHGSPCVDTGIPAGVTWDCIGAPRPMGITYDMGAYELNPAAVLSLAPTLLDFGEVVIGDAAQLPVSVKNVGNSTLNGTVNFVPVPIFSVAPGTYTLPVNDGTNVIVTFTPPLMYAWTQTVVFTSNGGDVDVTLIGTGIPEPLACAAVALVFMAVCRRLRM
ncbi:MAG: hypothetical protein NTV22_08315 [bacterium]|nr:hypothetical protein [bacterium]